jgi:hypothetical protein
VWIALVLRFVQNNRVRWQRFLAAAAITESIVLPVAFVSSPVIEHRSLTSDVDIGQSSRFEVQLPFAQQLEVSVDKLEGLPRGAGVWVTICGTAKENCVADQYGAGGLIYRQLPKGRVAIDVFNFKQNPVKTRATLTVRYVRRRYL